MPLTGERQLDHRVGITHYLADWRKWNGATIPCDPQFDASRLREEFDKLTKELLCRLLALDELSDLTIFCIDHVEQGSGTPE